MRLERGQAQPREVRSRDGRVTLRQFTPDDAPAIFQLIDQDREHLSQHGDTTAEKYPTQEAVLSSITHPTNPDRLRFGIRVQEDDLAGSINVTPDEDDPQQGEIGYYLGRAYTGRGYATTAVETLSDYAFDELGYHTLYGIVAIPNTDSAAVLTRAQYTERGSVAGESVFTRRRINY